VKSLILGYGKTGQSVEKYLKTISKEYLIYDDNLDLLKGINEKLVFKESQLKQIEEIIVSPGIKPDHKLLNEFPEKKVFTDIDLFSSKFEGVFIGVTGTNGKTTFVNLLSNFLNENGIESIACGNVGISPLEFKSNQKNYAVVELSSFQLFYSKNLKIDFGVFLNFHSDHLDWHGNIEEYKNSKIKLLSFLETNENLIVGKNTISSLKLEDILRIPSEEKINRNFIKKFDLKLSNYPIDTSLAFLKIVNKLNLNLEEAYKFLKIKLYTEHRFENFENINGTNFINDSKSTNFHSVSSASQRVKNALLIMHGITKKIPTSDLILSDEIKKVIIPKDMNLNKDLFNCEVEEIETIFDLEDILQKEFERFDNILFSCGGSSFNDFKNYIARGDFFKSIVKNIKRGLN
tara:strand:+ start:3018 stop:4229 length:1212 start_codon:yes stop_codon:yes gene_type:complete